MISAAIFVPPELPLDGVHTRKCHDHLLQSNYQLVAILRTWAHLDQAICDYGIQVIVSARGALMPDRYGSCVAIDLATE